MAQQTLTLKAIGKVFLFILLVSPLPVTGQFILPFLYMPLKSLFPNSLGILEKHYKVTSEHVRNEEQWSLENSYSTNMEEFLVKSSFINRVSFTAADLTNLNYYWSYTIPFNAVNISFSDPLFAATKTPKVFQEELLKFVSNKFFINLNDVASTLGIPAANLSTSYDPANWSAVVHAIIRESSPAFSRLLDLPSENSLAELVGMGRQDLFNTNLSRFEDLVFPFLPKKVTLDLSITSYLINSSGVIPGELYNDVTVVKILQQHQNLTLSSKQFSILYNLTTEQAKTIDRATFYQISRMCGISTDTILNITLPEVSWSVVGSVHITPPCPVLIAIKGKSIASFNFVINRQNNTVLEILTAVSNLTWRAVYHAVNASLQDWEYLDSVTLLQLDQISGLPLQTLLNGSISEAVELIFRIQANGTLISKTGTHRAFIRSLLENKFNLTLSEVANLTRMPEASLQDASSPWLFRSFLNATITYFGLNLSEIVASVQVSDEELFNLPEQEWEKVIPVIVDSVVKSEAADLQISTENLLQFLGLQSVKLSIAQLKELIKNQILDAKQKKKAFETDLISKYLNQNSVSDADYFNSTVLSLMLAASGYSSGDLILVYGYNLEQIFILGLMRISDLPLYCGLNNSAIKERTLYNITAELAGTKETPANCRRTRFYIAARYQNMSQLQEMYPPFRNASVSFVSLVENVTGLPWRQNVWAFGLKMEDWTVLYVLSKDSYKEVTSYFNLEPYLSRTLLQIFEKSLQLQQENNANLSAKIEENRGPTLDILYKLFNTSEDELREFGDKTMAQYGGLLPIQVFSLMIDSYLVGKFNVSVSTLEASLDLKPGDIRKLSPTEWPELIPFVKAEVIRSGRHQLGVSMSNFANLLQETPVSLEGLTLAQLESKWDNVVSRVLKGKTAIESRSLLDIITSIGIPDDSLDDETVLEFITGRINVTKWEMLLLYNFSSVAFDVLHNYTFVEIPGFCGLSKSDLLNKRPYQVMVYLLGHDNDMSCRKIALVAAASATTVNELAAKFSLDVKDDISLLTMFENLFALPWPKIAWAVNASLPDWPILGAVTLSDTATLTSQSTENMKFQKSFREITTQLLGLSENLYIHTMNNYRSILIGNASDLFGVNSSTICNGCSVVDILWNSLTQLNLLVDFDPNELPNELNVSHYEFNLTIPSQWSLMVQPIVRDSYSRAALTLGIDRNRLSVLLQSSTAHILNMNLKHYQAVLSRSINPFIVAKTALINSPLSDLTSSKGLNLSALLNESVFDVIDAILSVSIQNISFIFNWTAEQQAKLKNYTLDDMLYYREIGLQSLGSERLFTSVEYILQRSLPPRTTPTPTLPACKPGLIRVGNAKNCTDVDECSSNRCGDDSLCQNYRGGFDCECNEPGHFKVNINGKCKPCKTFKGTLTITNREYRSYLSDKTTEEFFDFKQKFENTVNKELRASSVNQFYYGCRIQEFRSGSVIVDFLIFTSPDFTGTITNLRNALIGKVNNSYLGPYNVTTEKIAVEDFDECQEHQDNCGHHATCVNNDGSFECKCDDGYDGDGLTCEAGFFKTMWWTVIVAAFLLLVIVIIIVCLVIKRPKPSGRFGLEMDDSPRTNESSRRYSEASKALYRSGDVYFKDKEGKLRPGTSHTTNNLNVGNGMEQSTHTPHFVEEDESAQLGNSMRDKTPFELAVERSKRNEGFQSSDELRGKSPFELAVEKNAQNGNVYEQTLELDMTELPYASIKT